VAHDEREWHRLRTGNDRCVRVRNQRPLALCGSMTDKPDCNLKAVGMIVQGGSLLFGWREPDDSRGLRPDL
jgi:hypothetical protein